MGLSQPLGCQVFIDVLQRLTREHASKNLPPNTPSKQTPRSRGGARTSPLAPCLGRSRPRAETPSPRGKKVLQKSSTQPGAKGSGKRKEGARGTLVPRLVPRELMDTHLILCQIHYVSLPSTNRVKCHLNLSRGNMWLNHLLK